MLKKSLKEISYENAHNKYGQDLPDEVTERIEHELELILNNNMVQKYIDIINFAKECEKADTLMFTRGCAGCSFILYLCGVTEVNPIPSLPCEFLMGYNGEKKPIIEFVVEKGRKSQLEGYANGNKVIESELLSALKHLELLTGTKSKDINIYSVDITAIYKEDIPFIEANVVNVFKSYKPKNIEELIKVFGLATGTGTLNNVVDINKAIAFREDVMYDLMKFGIDRACAFMYAEVVRKGAAALIIDSSIPKYYEESISRINYLMPRAHITECVIKLVRMLWYKQNYPVFFANVTSDK